MFPSPFIILQRTKAIFHNCLSFLIKLGSSFLYFWSRDSFTMSKHLEARTFWRQCDKGLSSREPPSRFLVRGNAKQYTARRPHLTDSLQSPSDLMLSNILKTELT